MDGAWLPTENQRRIVGLFEQGYGRWKVAEILGVSEASVKKSAGFLCRRFDCPVRELPAKLAEYDAAQEFSFRAPGPLEPDGEYDDAGDDGRVTV